jgi:hypothetical protein
MADLGTCGATERAPARNYPPKVGTRPESTRQFPGPTWPTLRFQVLYVFLVLAHDRRRILHWPVTFSLSSSFGISRLPG